MDSLTLSSDIRSGVTIPIFITVILSSLLRRYLPAILNPTEPPKLNLEDIEKEQLLARAKLLRQNGNHIPLTAFLIRRAHMVRNGSGSLSRQLPEPNPLAALTAARDPSAVVGMMKKQVSSIALSAGMGYLLSSLFSGFLVARAPFPLAYKFKSMLQKDIDVPNLEVNFVSSLSWYFFVLLSSSGLMTLIHHYLGDDNMEFDPSMDISAMVPGGGMMSAGGESKQPAGADTLNSGGMPGMGSITMPKMFAAEKEGLEMMVHNSVVPSILDQLVSQDDNVQDVMKKYN